MELDLLIKKLDIEFKNRDLLRNAFVHRSYLNENENFDLGNNERLEFLGDAVLQLLTSEFLFHKYPDDSEGLLTNYRSSLVNTKTLSESGLELNLGEHLFLSVGEEKTGGREREYILANTFEALLGAIYLDQGLSVCESFLEKHLFFKIEDIIKNKSYKDYKSMFQEKAQEKFKETPAYRIVEQWGPDHDKQFKIGVYIDKKLVVTGSGNSKQKAEQKAAFEAIKKLWP